MTDDPRLDQLLTTLQEVRLNLEQVRTLLTSLVQTSHDHEARLRILERWHSQLTSLLAAGAFITGALLQALLTRWL